MRKILILMTIMIIATTSTMAEEYRSTTYMTTVDSDYGFYQVRNLDQLSASVSFSNHTLEINTGDTVKWKNMANPEERLIIISDNNLWSNTTAVLPWSFRTYNYTFGKVGTYTIHLQGYPRLYQKIVVKEIFVSNPILIQDQKSGSTISNEIVAPPTPIATIKATSVSVSYNEPKKSPGFEILFALFGLIFLAKKR